MYNTEKTMVTWTKEFTMWMKWNSKETVNLLNVAFEGGGVMSEIMRTTDALKFNMPQRKS